jgi:hypothetical protein
MSRMLILTGPQGSGNHLFSKVLALHEDVYGWKTLLNTYWEGHHHEPFAEHWKNPELLHDFDWEQSDYYVTSISCPFFADGAPHIPDYQAFTDILEEYCEIDIAIIGRDQNILEYQQERVRGVHTTPLALDYFDYLFESFDVTFLSQELLYLYKSRYLEQVEKLLDFPIAHYDPELDVILQEDANRKYIKRSDEYWLDFEVHRAMRES